jgi:hypothetical protein
MISRSSISEVIFRALGTVTPYTAQQAPLPKERSA